MNMITHTQARELMALAQADALSAEQNAALENHLRDCPACRSFASAADRLAAALRAEPLPVNAALTRRLQRTVRERALDLRRQRERRWFILAGVGWVGGSATLSSALAWTASPWLQDWTRLPAWAWQAGDSFFWTAPVLAAAFVLLARNVDFNFIHHRLHD